MEIAQIRKAARAHSAELAAMGITDLYLFGSAARGTARDDSDIDLLYRRGGKAGRKTDPLHHSYALSPCFGCRADSANMRLVEESFLAAVMPQAVLVFGETPPAAAYKQQTGKQMSKDKNADLAGVHAEAAKALARLKQLIAEGAPDDLKDAESDAGWRALAMVKDQINNINDALNGRLGEVAARSEKRDAFLAKLSVIGRRSRHPHSEIPQVAANEARAFIKAHLADIEEMMAATAPAPPRPAAKRKRR